MNMNNFGEKIAFYRIRLLFLGAFLALLGAVLPVQAEIFDGNQLYVATDGNDNVTRADNNINKPWRTIAKAVELAQAGDVVNYRAGTYTLTSNIDPFGSIGNDGTASNRIVHTNYMNESVQFRDGGFRFFINHNYWTFSGIDVASSGRFLTTNDTRKGNNIIFEKGNYSQSTFGGGANHAPIVMVGGGNGGGDSSNNTVRNIRFTGPGESGNPNTALVMIFGSRGVKIYNNEFSNSPYCVYYKHPGVTYDTGIEIYNNYCHDSERGIGSAFIYANVHDNLLVNAGISIGIASGYTPDSGSGEHGGDDNTFRHNTIHNGSIHIKYEGDEALRNIIKDNILSSTTSIYTWESSNPAHNVTMANNLYLPGNVTQEYSSFYDLPGWRSKNGGDVNSIQGAPTYISGSPSSISDYELAAGSLGKNAASDGKDMGADISLVGTGFLGLARPKSPSQITPTKL